MLNQLKKGEKKWSLFTLLLCLMDLIIPFILGLFYPGYNHLTMMMSLLSSKDSPVYLLYNIWMLCLGSGFILVGMHLYCTYKKCGRKRSILFLVITLIYAVFDCYISAFFSLQTDNTQSLSHMLHEYGSSIGCTILVFAGLLAAMLLWNQNGFWAKILLICFILSMLSFSLFVMGEEQSVSLSGWMRILSLEGLWQRVSLAFMYSPYVILAALSDKIEKIKK